MTGTRQRPSSIAAVILAAGASTRFGTSKQLVHLEGRTMLERVVGKARVAGLDPILVVAPSALELPPGTRRVANDDPTAGMSRSLRLGVEALPPDVAAAVVL